ANIEANCGRERTPGISMYHPFGNMARLCRLEEFYSWLLLEPDLIHKVFEKQYRQLDALITRIKAPYMYSFASFEMALPPWMGRDAFDEFIYHYDLKMNKRIHEFGGKVRHHCHDKMFDYLVYWADMGVDSIEPLEMPPAGDTDLAEAKKLIGDRMSLAGNIPSQRFGTLSPDEIDHLVQNAIRDAAAGGGFILRCASLVAGLNSCRNEEQFAKWIPSVECFIESGLKHGGY
ncbi:MAG: hypothetical protein KAG97_09975, partial [Victivallales bacterium]|nr:hypothetical protein [Victivallales bacterium]